MAESVTKVQSMVVFGDSLSDIGTEKSTKTGKFAKLIGKLHTNKINRFTDGRNWTDFLTEWAGESGNRAIVYMSTDQTISASDSHRRVLATSNLHFAHDDTMLYVNYAQGGAVAAHDYGSFSKEDMLGHLDGQVERYISDRKELVRTHTDKQYFQNGYTLHVIWIGLNDIITVTRQPTPTDRDPQAGEGVRALVSAIAQQVNLLEQAFPSDLNRYVIMNLPGPQITVRWGKAADDKVSADLYKEQAVRFNSYLKDLTDGKEVPGVEAFKSPNKVSMIDMYSYMAGLFEQVNDGKIDFANKSQTIPVEDMPVRFDLDATEDDTYASQRKCFVVNDGLHPTEEVHRFIALNAMYQLVSQGFFLGNWRRDYLPPQLEEYKEILAQLIK
ncbi:SGNH/GDSL hydrolase family protein [Streptomyces sp. 900105245]